MEIEEIFRRDLNLLIALNVLIEEGSVSRSALRLNLSQSAMSRVLARLRELLKDPLFIRQGQHLQATQRAIDISKAVSEPLQSLCSVFSTDEFDPKHCSQHFTIATTDYAMQTILPFALPAIYEQAPNITLEFLPLKQHKLHDQLSTERVDMALCRPTSSVDSLQQQTLGRVSVLCMLSKSHPLADKVLTLEDYLTLPNALIAISDGVQQLIDESLRGMKKRKVVLRAYHLEAALAIVDKMPLIITVPADLAYLVAEKHNLVVKALPFEFKPFDYSLIWHQRCAQSASQIWLRQIITEQCGGLMDKRVKEMGLVNGLSSIELN